ncbi:DoxX family protein [Sphingomonas nostoxanthinifaciens]|uniref:DoxX family protein n=1 Tax=Sphingomonas nostoxanthinifaciens TaxID=2872652 RepID=UPI001CC1F959|nr:DoxX family protein [Sphingomonas nostoxanthinifaciens]
MSSSMVWLGRALSLIVVSILLADGAVGLFAPEQLRANVEETGWTVAQLPVIATTAIASAILYAIPRTKTLGAILITAFAGGAVCTHVRIGEFGSPPQIVCILLAVGAWGGLYLRDARVRALLPLA